VVAIAFSPDMTRIASGFRDGTIRPWDIESGQQVAVLRTHGRV
jgi:WD40 repeat protein